MQVIGETSITRKARVVAGVLLAEEPIRYSFYAIYTKRMIRVDNATISIL